MYTLYHISYSYYIIKFVQVNPFFFFFDEQKGGGGTIVTHHHGRDHKGTPLENVELSHNYYNWR